MIGLNEEIEYIFLIAGHTKCFCDACFGMLKRFIKKHDITSPQVLKDLINQSSKANEGNVIIPSQVQWIDWKQYLEQIYSEAVPSISNQHLFFFKKILGTEFLMKENSSKEPSSFCPMRTEIAESLNGVITDEQLCFLDSLYPYTHPDYELQNASLEKLYGKITRRQQLENLAKDYLPVELRSAFLQTIV